MYRIFLLLATIIPVMTSPVLAASEPSALKQQPSALKQQPSALKQQPSAVKQTPPIATPEPANWPLTITASEDATFNRYFNRCGPGWTGGDSTYSTPISATQVMWLFSDAFIGPVNQEGIRNPDTGMFVPGNTLVLQDKTTGAFTTYQRQKNHGATAQLHSLPSYTGSPYDKANCPDTRFIQKKEALAAFQPSTCPSAKHCYYWGGAILADKKHLYTFLQLMEQTGPDAFDFSWHNSAMAVTPLRVFDSTSDKSGTEPVYLNIPDNGVSYGGAVIPASISKEKYSYIYGMRAEPAGNTTCSGHCLHIARVPANHLTRLEKWRYWGQISRPSTEYPSYGWTKNASSTVAMSGITGPLAAPKTQDQLGVTRLSRCGKLPACYVIIAHQYTGSFTGDILAWYAAQPQGPWSGPVLAYKTPEADQPGQLFTYNAKIHPEFTNENGLLVSYDVNSLAPLTDPLNAFITAASYRPRFIRVQLHWAETGSH